MPKGTKILYVEDEPFLAKIVLETLESQGYEVCLVEEGLAVLSVMQEFLADIAVLDIMLPGKDGFEIAEELRNKYPRLPIIFLTAKQQIADVKKGFESGGNDYLKKPFSMEELMIRIENLCTLTSIATHEKSAKRIGQFTFDEQKYTLTSEKRLVKLSHRETQILSYLLAHQSSISNRKDMLLKIWGDDSFYNSRNLDVYIRKIRTYLSFDPRIEIITLKGVGYRIICNS